MWSNIKDLLSMLSFLFFGALAALFIIIFLGNVSKFGYEKYSCPRLAGLYETEYKIVAGDCYLKTSNNKWVTDTKYKSIQMIDSIDVNDNAKVMLIKNIEK